MKQQTSTKAFAVLSTASVISKTLAFLYLPIQAMLVHDFGNGVISAGFKLYILLYALTNAGLPLIISKFIAEQVDAGDYKGAFLVFRSAFTISLALGLLSSLFTFFASGLLAAWCGMPEARLMFLCIAPAFLFSAVSCAMHGYFQGRHTMTPTALAQILEQLVNSGLTVLFEVLLFRFAIQRQLDAVSYTAAGSSIATVVAVASSALFLTGLFLLDRHRNRAWEASQQSLVSSHLRARDVYRRLLSFMLPAMLTVLASGAMDLIDTRMCIPMLVSSGYSTGQAYSLFGIYATKYQRLLTLPLLFATPMVTAIIPALSAAHARKETATFLHKVQQAFRMNCIVVLPITAAIALLSKPVITLIFLAENKGAMLLSVGIWAAVLFTVQTIQSGVLIALNQPRIPPLSMLAGMLAKIACNYFLIPIPSIHIYGALIGNGLALLISIAINQAFIHKSLGQSIPIWRFFKMPWIASMLMGLMSLGVYTGLYGLFQLLSLGTIWANDLALLFTVPFGAVVYFILSVRMGIIHPGDLEQLPCKNLVLMLSNKIPFLTFPTLQSEVHDGDGREQ